MAQPVGRRLGPVVTGAALAKKPHLLFGPYVLTPSGAQSRQ
jgi:hypothetical protein